MKLRKPCARKRETQPWRERSSGEGASTPSAHSPSSGLGARLRGAMDVALLHSLLEANCSLALAEELFSDGWAQSLDPEGPFSYCNTTLDQIGTCWPQSAAGALVERPCPEYFNGVKYNTTRNAYRECLENGTWASRIDYSQCVPILDDKQRKYSLHYHIALVVNYLGHCVSVAALTAAFLLFLALRNIRCLRNVIHWNLITTFILRNVTWFLLQLIDHEVHESNEVWCRCVTAAFNYFVVTNFFWMFVEGCYLHTAIVMAYSTERLRKWLFLVIGWCIPCPITMAWALGKLYYENEQCWFGKEPGDLVDYIYQGPIILVLLDPHDKITSIHRIRDDPVQEGGEGHPGPPAPAGHHLHAVPGQPRAGRPVADCVRLLQLLPAVLPGLLCVCLLLLLKWRGALSREEEVAPVAGPSLPPCPRSPGHVHPHVSHTDQLPQHQADCHCVIPSAAALPATPRSGQLPGPPPPPALGSPCHAALVRTEGREEPSSPACAAAQGAPRVQGQWGRSTAEESQEVWRRSGHHLQAFVRTSLSCYTLMVAPLTGEETETQSQEGPAQVPHLVRGGPGLSAPLMVWALLSATGMAVLPACSLCAQWHPLQSGGGTAAGVKG